MATTKFESTNLSCYRGDTETYTFNVTSGGAAYNLAGATIVATGRLSPQADATLFQITVTDGQLGSNFATGVVVLQIPAATTATFPPTLVYDLRSTLAGVITTLARGQISVTLDINSGA